MAKAAKKTTVTKKKAATAKPKATKKAAVKVKPKEITRYISRLPKTIPEGLKLCHNHVRPAELTTVPNQDGFRAWVTNQPPKGFKRCSCGWAGLPHLAYPKK